MTSPAQTTSSAVPLLAALLISGERLAEALRAENAALAALDLPRAASLGEPKIHATAAFAAAHQAVQRTGVQVAGPIARSMTTLADDLARLGAENCRLLQRAVAIQARVIEVIAGAALPRAAAEGARYGAAGQQAAPRRAVALAVQTRV